jgi:1-acyl-sn-glycerol-3-phosphate acyltransferase
MAPQELVERPVQLRGSRVARAALRLAGWQLDFNGLPARQGVAIVYPHTSNWDFVVGICAKWAIGIPVVFWGKDALFRVPVFGIWLRWLGGVPVDRGARHGMVGDMVRRMGEARARDDFFWLAWSPEGTRAWTPRWRSGFYQVAVGACAATRPPTWPRSTAVWAPRAAAGQNRPGRSGWREHRSPRRRRGPLAPPSDPGQTAARARMAH